MGKSTSTSKLYVNFFVYKISDKGAMGGELTVNTGIAAPFVPKDRFFHFKICKLHWRGTPQVKGNKKTSSKI